VCSLLFILLARICVGACFEIADLASIAAEEPHCSKLLVAFLAAMLHFTHFVTLSSPRVHTFVRIACSFFFAYIVILTVVQLVVLSVSIRFENLHLVSDILQISQQVLAL
jgi:hypothetical protein